jgi:hypothetical protein
MGINDIQLSSAIVAALYRDSLIETNEEAITPASPQKTTNHETHWKFLGNNEKNILIVVNYPDSTYLPDEELSFLTNILAACKLTLADTAIINLNNHSGISYKNITGRFSSRTVLLFGISPLQFGLPIDFPHYQVQSFDNCDFLFSPPMEERHVDELFKSKLWVSLRRIFGI